MKRALAVTMFSLLLGAATPGEPAPALTGVSQRGAPVLLARLRGRVVVVDFWASWCEPCRRAFPTLDSLAQRHGARGLTVVGVSVDDEAASYQRFVAELRPGFAVVHDASHQIAERWSPPSMPTTYVVGRDGRVRAALTGDGLQHLEAQVVAALAE
jgi:cytochrome c biogenesis protein CcmG/thiol:disulfide interchange protein DsbE